MVHLDHDKIKSLCQELQALKEQFTEITQLRTKTCSAQKTMVELLATKLANKDTASQQGTINEKNLQQTIAKQLELSMPSRSLRLLNSSVPSVMLS